MMKYSQNRDKSFRLYTFLYKLLFMCGHIFQWIPFAIFQVWAAIQNCVIMKQRTTKLDTLTAFLLAGILGKFLTFAFHLMEEARPANVFEI